MALWCGWTMKAPLPPPTKPTLRGLLDIFDSPVFAIVNICFYQPKLLPRVRSRAAAFKARTSQPHPAARLHRLLDRRQHALVLQPVLEGRVNGFPLRAGVDEISD